MSHARVIKQTSEEFMEQSNILTSNGIVKMTDSSSDSITARVGSDVKNSIAKFAKSQNISISDVVRDAISSHLYYSGFKS